MLPSICKLWLLFRCTLESLDSFYMMLALYLSPETDNLLHSAGPLLLYKGRAKCTLSVLPSLTFLLSSQIKLCFN